MMVKWANEGFFQAHDGKMPFNDGEMLVNDGEMRFWSYTHFTIIDKHFTIINEHFTIITKHFTIISLKYTIIHSFDHHWEAAPTDNSETSKQGVTKEYLCFFGYLDEQGGRNKTLFSFYLSIIFVFNYNIFLNTVPEAGCAP